MTAVGSYAPRDAGPGGSGVALAGGGVDDLACRRFLAAEPPQRVGGGGGSAAGEDDAARGGDQQRTASSPPPSASAFEEEWRVMSIRYPTILLRHEGKQINLYELVCGNFVGQRGRKLDTIRSKLGSAGFHLRVNHQLLEADEHHTYVAVQVSVLGLVMDQALRHLLEAFQAAAQAVLLVHPHAGPIHVTATIEGEDVHCVIAPAPPVAAAVLLPPVAGPQAGAARAQAPGKTRPAAAARPLGTGYGQQAASLAGRPMGGAPSKPGGPVGLSTPTTAMALPVAGPPQRPAPQVPPPPPPPPSASGPSPATASPIRQTPPPPPPPAMTPIVLQVATAAVAGVPLLSAPPGLPLPGESWGSAASSACATPLIISPRDLSTPPGLAPPRIAARPPSTGSSGCGSSSHGQSGELVSCNSLSAPIPLPLRMAAASRTSSGDSTADSAASMYHLLRQRAAASSNDGGSRAGGGEEWVARLLIGTDLLSLL